MIRPRLTDEQVEMAEKAFFRLYREHGGNDTAALRAAAEYLQMPWAEPTEEELSEASRGQGPSSVAIRAEIIVFVQRRNAALRSPTYDDPRTERINAVLAANGWEPSKYADLVHVVISAMDEMKP